MAARNRLSLGFLPQQRTTFGDKPEAPLLLVTRPSGGDRVIIHHGRRPALPPPLPPPPLPLPLVRPPQALFERGIVDLTLFVAGHTTLRFHAQSIEHIIPFHVLRDPTRLVERGTATTVTLRADTRKHIWIQTPAHEHITLLTHATARPAILETETIATPLWAFREQQVEQIAVSLTDTMIWDIKETRHQSCTVYCAARETGGELPQEILMHALAFAVAHVLEEDV